MDVGRNREQIDELKRRLTTLSYARNVLNLPIHSSGDRCISVGGGHNPTAMVVYEDWWYDFKLGRGGDVIDLCAVAKHGGDRGVAIRELCGDLGLAIGWRDVTQKLNDSVAWYHDQLRPQDREYLRSRRITDETTDRLRLGYNPQTNRLVIPYYKNGYVAYIVSRRLSSDESEPKYKKAPLTQYNENIPWGLHTIGRDKQLVITEGAFDALSFEQEGYPVLSPMGGYFNKPSLKQVLDVCRNSEKGVFICFDSDGPGSRFQLDMCKTLWQNRITFTCGSLQDKDVSDYYAAGGDLDQLVAEGQPGEKVLCQRIASKEEFKTFILQAARFVGKSEIAELFDQIGDKFPSKWLSVLQSQALSVPSEDIISQEIKEKYQLKFFENTGFYEYSLGVWRRRADTEIRQKIAEALGHYKAGSKVNSILTLVKAAHISDEHFNEQPIFNFQNCILNLATETIDQHSPSYLSSVQVDYAYDPEATCPRWEGFIRDITDDNVERQLLLQEMAGYVLFSDNSLQKCFYLLGSGANGKSVYLDVLAELFGRENISNVEMSSLIEPFQRIQLQHSIANLSTETQTNVKGAESIFKQIVVGDAINGCYKNKDFVSFRTRSKLFIASNNLISSRDVSDGLLRRICFVSFPVKFVDHPESEGERQADKHILSKLLAELPGIFNWTYDGYKRLKKNQAFTVTQDSVQLLEDFTCQINPVTSFIDDNLEYIYGDHLRSELYKMYRSWCMDTGHESMSQTRFTGRLKQTLAQKKIKFSEKKVQGERKLSIMQEGREEWEL